jgi:L-asparaginase
VTHAVTLLENNALFNSGHGAVFTRDGTNELEASVMVSRGYRKRGVGVIGLRHVKNPIKLAREMLLKGEEQDEKSGIGGGGAQGHCQLSGPTLEKLAEKWGLEMVGTDYFFTQARWDEHKRGLDREKNGGDPTWDADNYLPQGTVGAVALDKYGVLAVGTSTGGLTNKLSGRIGDTPTLGAGFWAEEWQEDTSGEYPPQAAFSRGNGSLVTFLPESMRGAFADCFPSLSLYDPIPPRPQSSKKLRATAMSGTGNGDSFLRMNAVRTAGAIARYSPSTWPNFRSLQSAITEMAGPGGELQKSAEDRWRHPVGGEGEGGIIGIELIDGKGHIAMDFNCGGMFRTWVDDRGEKRCYILKDEPKEFST